MKIYTVVLIGCIECGNDSELIGHYRSEEEANVAAREYRDEHEIGGDYLLEIFEGELS